MEWKKPNTITGPTAEGTKYFNRANIEEKLWRKIESNHHILFLAPRRVGKSSIVINMAKNPKDGYACLYENIATESSLQDFYRRLYGMTLKSLNSYQKTKNIILKWLKTLKVTSINPDGEIKIDTETPDYKQLFLNLVANIPKNEVKVVLFLDEFPDVVLNIFKNRGSEEAQKLLTDIRSFDEAEFKSVFMMVLLGSVGLTHVIKQITGRVDKVNNLHKEYLRALDDHQVNKFIEFLVKDASMQVDEKTCNYLTTKIGHHIPYYLQLVIEECDDLLEETNTPHLSTFIIDKAYKQLLSKNEHFLDWDSRLTEYFKPKYPFLLAVLKKCAHNTKISIQEIANIAKKNKNEIECKADLDDILIADGYLYEVEDNIYSFNSPLLRDWWKNRHPNI